MPRVIVAIKNGEVIIDSQGFVGAGCEENLEKLMAELKKLGVTLKVQEHHLKSEYYQEVEVKENVEVET